MSDKPKFSFGAAKPQVPAAQTQEEKPAAIQKAKSFGALFGGNSPSRAEAGEAAATSNEVAAVESEGVTPAELPTPAMAIVPAEPEAVEIPDMAANLKALDELFVEGHGYAELTLSSVRNRVSAVMIELKEKPELLSIVQAKDTRNIMAYIQQTQANARLNFKDKAEKAAKKTTKKNQKATFTFGNFSGALEAAAKEVASEKKAVDLQQIAQMDLSDVAAQFTKKW